MVEETRYAYDVFISYSHADRDWVRGELLPRLEEAGLRVIIDYRDFRVGVPLLKNIEQLVDNSRHTLLVMTPAWIDSEWTEFESLLAGTADPAGRKRKLLPLMLHPCQPPARIAMLNYASFTDPASRDEEMTRLLRALGTEACIFISYKRNVEPDESLAMRLYDALVEAGRRVFIDQTLKVGVEWAVEVERQIAASDYVLVLLSEASVHSEMVAGEIECAHKHFQETGRSRLLPVRVNYRDPLPYHINHYLDKLQYAEWNDDADNDRLIRQVVNAIGNLETLQSPESMPFPVVYGDLQIAPPRPYADPRFIESLAEPSGAVRLHSAFYIARKGDELLNSELRKAHGTTTTIRAPRQTGKSSLLVRGISQAQERGSRVVFIDLQPVEDSYLQSLDTFLHYFTQLIVAKLQLDPAEVTQVWSSALGPSDKTTYLMEGYVLSQVGKNMVLALDEVDRLLATTFHDNFFGLLRFWHNSRAMNELWENLDIVMVISTEPHLLVSDVTQSPFNVGLKIRLDDFSEQQVQVLNERHRSPLRDHEISALMEFLNGHPYLTRKALYTMLTESMTWDELTRVASTENGPFGDHLRHYLWLLRGHPELRIALRQIIQRGRCPDEIVYYRLLQAGVIKGPTSESCACRCRLYEEYLKDRL